MNQKAKKVAAATVTEYVRLMGVPNIVHPLEVAAWWTRFFGPEISVEQNRERHP